MIFLSPYINSNMLKKLKLRRKDRYKSVQCFCRPAGEVQLPPKSLRYQRSLFWTENAVPRRKLYYMSIFTPNTLIFAPPPPFCNDFTFLLPRSLIVLFSYFSYIFPPFSFPFTPPPLSNLTSDENSSLPGVGGNK